MFLQNPRNFPVLSRHLKGIIMLFISSMLFACASQSRSVYQQIGGAKVMAQIVDNFIAEIKQDDIMLSYFRGADVARFREKMNEHLCQLAGGGCTYTGDSMEEVHIGMNLTETHFNHGVDLFIRAMEKAGVPHRQQNKLLAVMVPTRDQMIYLE